MACMDEIFHTTFHLSQTSTMNDKVIAGIKVLVIQYGDK